MSKSTVTSFTVAEDRHLSSVYLEISRDSIVDASQSKDQFWSRVSQKYHSSKSSYHVADRTQRSLQSRMSIILKYMRIFNSCPQQSEYINPSGANEQILLQHANELMMQQGYESGFQFDHVWSLLKEHVQGESMSGDSSLHEENILEPSNPSLSSAEINSSSDENFSTSNSTSQRPQSVKKSKLKRKQHANAVMLANKFKERTDKLVEELRKSVVQRDIALKLEMKKIEVMKQECQILELRREDKVMLLDLDTISDPKRRELLHREQQKIMQKRRQEDF